MKTKHELEAKYFKTNVRSGLAIYKIFVDGKQYGIGGLPQFVHGLGEIEWLAITGKLDYIGKRKA